MDLYLRHSEMSYGVFVNPNPASVLQTMKEDRAKVMHREKLKIPSSMT